MTDSTGLALDLLWCAVTSQLHDKRLVLSLTGQANAIAVSNAWPIKQHHYLQPKVINGTDTT